MKMKPTAGWLILVRLRHRLSASAHPPEQMIRMGHVQFPISNLGRSQAVSGVRYVRAGAKELVISEIVV